LMQKEPKRSRPANAPPAAGLAARCSTPHVLSLVYDRRVALHVPGQTLVVGSKEKPVLFREDTAGAVPPLILLLSMK
jgi:hypothetical protein